ncbi:hypothetical protein DY000_02015429 [Brassica cretica]|uniref:Uncharacterized protein n=1 Tax=Brassica cretica TaxID=69181 RepID=A0ABQ7D2A8_BRACR|nr:hypothetical protein DY000_02015429 [Brassica cretica]
MLCVMLAGAGSLGCHIQIKRGRIIASLEEDIDRAIDSLKAIHIRLRRGEYAQYSQTQQENEEENEDGDEEDASE